MTAQDLGGDQVEAELLPEASAAAELLAGDQVEAELLPEASAAADLLAGRPAIGCRRRLPSWLFPYWRSTLSGYPRRGTKPGRGAQAARRRAMLDLAAHVDLVCCSCCYDCDDCN